MLHAQLMRAPGQGEHENKQWAHAPEHGEVRARRRGPVPRVPTPPGARRRQERQDVVCHLLVSALSGFMRG